MREKTITQCAGGLCLLFLLAGTLFPLSAQEQDGFLKGKVHYLSRAGSFADQIEQAEKTFRQKQSQGFYFTGWLFASRHSCHMGGKWDKSREYTVFSRSDKIKFRKKSGAKSGYSIHTEEDEGGPAALLILHQIQSGSSRIRDLRLLDLDDAYEFSDAPLYWMGEVETAASMGYLTGEFKHAQNQLKESLLFAIGSHDTSDAARFLHQTAKGEESLKVKKSAIFWLGNIREKQSLDFLKDIYAHSRENKIREQIVFALSLNKSEAATKEIIRIARTDESRKIRKSAIFWLGQKASEESIRFLKGVVENSPEDEVKDSAVFAISQLPKDKSVPLLIEIAKTNKSASVRKKAIFWLGQTGDEKALEFFEEILFKK